uniref:Predicted protein n=1 Tax=Hordeum vulgare subsp. vulgare TaxID=112509 RepID=F2EBU7_HORVV|nr:predicted protein [Hordeum vulgare subsp. vulgare]
MLRCLAPSLRRAVASSAVPRGGGGGARLPDPGLSSPRALLRQWRRCASVDASLLPPPPPRQGGRGSSASSLNPAEVAKFAAIAETW